MIDRSRWGVSQEAVDLLEASDVIDLHLDLEVPVRVYGYDPAVRHETSTVPPRFWGHTDYPKLREAGFTAVAYDIATNPFRPAQNRLDATLANIETIVGRVDRNDDLALITDRAGYDRARAAKKLGLWLAIQGGNAFAADPAILDGPTGDLIHRITLIHLTNSVFGGTNSPVGRGAGITDAGRDLVKRCNRRKILVDLAHASKATFWGALEVHDPSLPPIVSHTGIEAVYAHWRNIDDAQIKAIADRGGVVGVMFQSAFLENVPMFGRGSRKRITDHLAHIVDLVGDDVAAIGTDYDGAITPPSDLPDVTGYVLLVQDMLDRGWNAQRIGKILGGNYLRVMAAIRG
jgi:membrane dipeptidase